MSHRGSAHFFGMSEQQIMCNDGLCCRGESGIAWLLIGCLMAALMVGCGRNSERANVDGTVTFDGKPVPGGSVVFSPDVSKGHRGPEGFAPIENGRYDTKKSGKGATPGPLNVTIYGYESTPGTNETQAAEGSPGKPLFPPYTTHIEVSEAAHTFNFDVRATTTPKNPAAIR